MKNLTKSLSLRFATLALSLAYLTACTTLSVAPAGDESGTVASMPASAASSAAKSVSAKPAAPNIQADVKPDFKSETNASKSVEADKTPDLFALTTGPESDPKADAPAHKKQYGNLWERVRAGFSMPHMEGPLVESHERWFVRNPEYIERMLQRANLYLFHIVEEVEKRGLPMEIALLPAIESAYQPRAYSHARASGLWQFIPSTGKLYGLKSDWWYDGRRDVLASTRAALDYLEKLSKDFDGDWQLALASYNCGEGKVGRMREYNRKRGLPTDYQDLKLPRETQHYVPKLMAMVNIVRDPARFGLELRDIPNSPYFVQVDTGSQIDMGVVAKLTNLEVDDLYNMNPGFNRWATSPKGPHHLLVPVSTKAALLEGLSDLAPADRVQWARHEVKRGDNLGRIAHNYGVTAEVIRVANNLSSNRVRNGQNLLIPVSGRKLLVAEGATPEPSLQTAKAASLFKHTAQSDNGNKVRVIHRVRSGETLYSIAKRYNVYVNQITRWNFMRTRDVLKMGQKLLIWTKPQRSSAAEPADDNRAAG